MNQDQTYVIRFENLSVAETNQRASELRDTLLDLTPEVNAEILKDDQSTQDFGATLVLVLGAPAIVIIAKGIADYLSRVGATIIIQSSDGIVIAEGIKSQDAAHIAQSFSQKK